MQTVHFSCKCLKKLIIYTLAVSVPMIWATLLGNSFKMSIKGVLWTKQVIVKHPYRCLGLLLTS